MKRYFLIFFFLLSSLPVFSFHIIGGEMIYNNLGNNKYEIVLKIYRDYSSTGFDAPAHITVYNKDSLVTVFDMQLLSRSIVPDAFNNACIVNENTTKIEEGIYIDTLTLAPRPGGYTIIYQRCCRNSSIVNIVNPGGQGATYYTKIPGPEEALINSSPRFVNFPPIFICQDVNFQFDHSAIDPDGDQLVYSLCAPYTGLDACCPTIKSGQSAACSQICPDQAPPPPYLPVVFAGDFSPSNPIASNPAFSINPTTGLLVGTPTLQGQYVVSVCIEERRNNVVINTHFRDFQFLVITCTVNVLSAIADQQQQCQGLTIQFINQSRNESDFPNYFWDFGVPGIASDTSNIYNPKYTYPDTGIYMVSLVNNPGAPCSDTLIRKVYVYPALDIKFPRNSPQCFLNNSLNYSVSGTYVSNASFYWDFSSMASPASSTLQNPSGIHYTKPGLYKVTLNARQYECEDSYTDTIRIFQKPFAKINNIQSALCDPATVGFSNGSKSELPLKYKWIFSDGQTSGDFEPSVVFSPAGTYKAILIVESTSPCADSSMHQISNILVDPSPQAEFKVTPAETTIFDPDISINSTASKDVIKTTFDFGDGQGSEDLQNLHTYSAFGNYRIKQTVTNSYGCVDTASSIVKILPEFRFWIPNSFTPDGNERNDLFMPSTYGVSVYEFEIFDSWGKKIFKTNKTEEGWNGSYNGSECQQGMYVWKISFKNAASGEREVHTGHVMLLRNP